MFDTKCALYGLYLAIFGLFRGHIVEIKGNKELFVTGQLRRTWSVATVSLCLSFLLGVKAVLGQKKPILGHKIRSFGWAPPDLAPLPGAPPESFFCSKLGFGKATT